MTHRDRVLEEIGRAAIEIDVGARVREKGEWIPLAPGPAGLTEPSSVGAARARLVSVSQWLGEDCEAWCKAGPGAGGLLRAMELVAERLVSASDAEAMNEELAESLSRAFERADVTLALATAMRSPDSPIDFIVGACEELRSALGLEWAGVLFDNTAIAPAALVREPLFALSGEWTTENAAAAAHALAKRCDLSTGPWVTTFESGSPSTLGSGLLQPFDIERQPAGVLVAGRSRPDLKDLDSYHLTLTESVCAFFGPFMENLLLQERDRGRFFATLEALSSTLDAKDPYTHGHSDRVAVLAARIGKQLNLDRQTIETLEIAGQLHDVGKIGVPEAVLLKPGALTDDEFDAIKRHPTIGYDILKGVPGLEQVLPGVLHHHERWDGRGYPDGLAGENIPYIARILAVADTFDAMSSKRSYRDAMPREKVLAVIAENRGSQFEAAIADAFLAIDLAWYDGMVEQSSEREQAGRKAA